MDTMYPDLEGLPGFDLVLEGLQALAAGQLDRPGVFLVAMARSKLRGLGLDVPEAAEQIHEPELALYALLGQSDPEPYAEYKALRHRLAKFESALDALRDRQELAQRGGLDHTES